MQDRYTIKKETTKPKILFVHGFASSKNYANALQHENINFEMLGLNLPNEIPNGQSFLSIECMANRVRQYIFDNKLSNLIVVGHSMGGAVVTNIATMPEIIKVVLLAPFHPFVTMRPIDWLLPATLEQAKTNLYRLVHDVNIFKKIGGLQLVATSELKHTTKFYEGLVSLVEHQIRNPQYWMGEMLQKFTQAAKTSKLLIIGATEDEYIDYAGLVTLSSRLNIPLLTIEQCGHAPIFEKPQEMATLLNKIVDDITQR